MTRLYRPHVPLSVRCKVAERQILRGPLTFSFLDVPAKPLARRLKLLLWKVATQLGCEVSELRLDHDPPLGARPKHEWLDGFISYTPAANDPDHLVYRPHGPEHAGSHLIKTNVRGDHGQHPDRVLIKKARRAEAAKSGKPPKRKIKIPSAKKPWPKRPFSNKRSK